VPVKEKNMKKLASLTLLKKGVGSGVGSGSGSITQRYRSGSEPKCHGSPTLLFTKVKCFEISIKRQIFENPFNLFKEKNVFMS
jgi:hypothetical protein